MHLSQAGRHIVEVHALCATRTIASQAPVADPVGGEQVPWPLVAPAPEGQEALILKHLCLHWACHNTSSKNACK